MKICRIDGCESPVKYSQLCSVHVSRKEHHGDPLWQPTKIVVKQTSKICTVVGCERPSVSKNLCKSHSGRLRRLGRVEEYVELTCMQCGQAFTSSRRLAKYCSKKCNAAANYIANRPADRRVRLPRTVDFCIAEGCEEPVHAKSLCKSHWQRMKKTGLLSTRIEKACEQCGKTFTTSKKRTQRFCSSACNGRSIYLRDVEAFHAYQRAWNKTHRDMGARLAYRRRATEKQNETLHLSPKDRRRLYGSAVCTHCGEPFTENNPLQLDHIIPVSRGGRHSIGNLMALCRHCNASKNDKFYSVWRYRTRV